MQFKQTIIQSYHYIINSRRMGCVDSTIHADDIITLLNENTKQRFRNIIADDDLPALIELESSTNYPVEIQLSDNGLLWTTLHFCCRFDAPRCLQYFLKKCYLQKMKQYLIFINQATAEGSTCLHLCGIWGSLKCFALLVSYGGLNLNSKDKLQKTVVNIMNDYDRQQMGDMIVALKNRYEHVTKWNLQRMEEITDIQKLGDGKYYKDLLERTMGKLKDEIQMKKQCGGVTEEENQLREEKGKLEMEREQLRLEISEIQKTVAKSNIDEKIKKESAHQKSELFLESSRVFDDDQTNLRKKLSVKEEQIQRIKELIQNLNIQAVNKSIIVEQERTAKLQKNKDQILKRFTQFKENVLAMKKEKGKETNAAGKDQKQEKGQKVVKPTLEQTPIKSNQIQVPVIETEFKISSKNSKILSNQNSSLKGTNKSMKDGCLASEDMKNFNILPQKIKSLYREAKQIGEFIDIQFNHNQNSLGGPEHQIKMKPFLQALTWLRPPAFLNDQFQLFDGIDPSDIKQGQLGVCYCLATISQLARDPENIKDIFIFYDLAIGFYVLKFFTNGRINYVVLDDYFPCNSSTKQPLFSKPIGNQIWVLLIQKGWSKIVGSYFAAELMTPDLFMQDLKGYPTYGSWFKDKTQKMKDILTYYQKNYPIVLTTGSKKIQGIVNNHAYSLLSIIEHEGSHIYKLRNPWGRFQWNGCYGDQSTLWTAELKLKCKKLDGDDGIFFLSESQLLQAFEYYSIAFDQDKCQYSYIQFNSNPEQDLFFEFNVQKDCSLALKITQTFKRLLKNKDYKYSSVIFELGKIQGNAVKFLSQGNDKSYFGDKSIYVCNQIFNKYEKGQYFLRIKIQWNDPIHFNTAVLSAFCEQEIIFQRLQQERGQSLWKKLLLSFIQGKTLKNLNDNISFCMQWMKGQMICYSLLRQSAKGDSFHVKWVFNMGELKNCVLKTGKTSDNTIEFNIDRAVKFGIGTLDRLSIAKACQSGNVSIQSLKL